MLRVSGLYQWLSSVRGSVRRRMLVSRPFRGIRARRYAARGRAFCRQHADRGRQDGDLVDRLRQDGACVLAPERLPRLLDPTDLRIADVLRRKVLEGHAWPFVEDVIESDRLLAWMPDVYRIGLSPPLLAAAEAYIGQEALYLGAMMKREIPDGLVQGLRKWHRDVEDERIFRMILYLGEVSPGGGPFAYIMAPLSQAVAEATGYRHGFLSDETVDAIVPKTEWTAVHGAAGTAVVFDGAKVFHRVECPRAAERVSLTLTYVSRVPLELKVTARLPRSARRAVARALDAGMARHLPRARLL